MNIDALCATFREDEDTIQLALSRARAYTGHHIVDNADIDDQLREMYHEAARADEEGHNRFASPRAHR